MLKQFLTTSIFLSITINGFAQVGIGTTSPHASSRLEVSATDKGLLIHRIALTANNDVSTISNPEKSLLVYNTTTEITIHLLVQI